jgi:hypothetical protein
MIFPDDSVICMIQSLYDQEISCGDNKTDSVICMIQSLYDQEISCGDSKTDSVIYMIRFTVTT